MCPFALVLVVFAVMFVPVATDYVKRYSIPLRSAAGIYGCFLLLLAYAIAPAIAASRTLLQIVLERRFRPLILLVLLFLPYLVCATGTHDFRWSACSKLLAIAGVPIVLYSAFPVCVTSKLNWQDALAGSWLVSIVLLHLFNGIWNVPANLDFMARLFVLSLGALCWTYLRQIPDLGYRLEFSKMVLLAALKNFLLFAAIAIPLGLWLGFTSWNPRWHGVMDFLVVYLEIFLFIALLEEIFFRGFLQNLLAKSLASWWRGQLMASLTFGLFHVLHAPFPNWRYVVLAFIAGWFYGSAYRASGTLFSSALLHAMVDTLWRTFFTRA